MAWTLRWGLGIAVLVSRLRCLLSALIVVGSGGLLLYAAIGHKSQPIGRGEAADNVVSIDVVVPFVAKSNRLLTTKFAVLVSSMLEHVKRPDIRPIRLHVIGDEESIRTATGLVSTAVDSTRKNRSDGLSADVKVMPYDVDQFSASTDALVVPAFQRHFVYKPGVYYSGSLFFFSTVLHRLLPDDVDRVVVLDADLRFRSDISDLHAEFNRFDEHQLIGIAHEQQPVYRHIFHAYRKLHPKTGVGGDAMSVAHGFPGFNSGVLLLRLDRMRTSVKYAGLLDASVVDRLADSYQFRGHLGDQDFFTLIGIDNRELFFVLDCTWNRQMCTWWRDLGYQDVFDRYHECKAPARILHGNCNTEISK